MLTRLEVDGFKTFEGLDVSFEPFTVVVGSNAAGKSNLFDVLQLLSNLAHKDINASVRELRGEPIELFRDTPLGRADEIRLAVEVLLDPSVRDVYGREIRIRYTRLRYELVLKRRQVRPGMDRIFVVRERVVDIKSGSDKWASRVKGRKTSAYLRYGRRESAFLETRDGVDGPEFELHQDDRQGRVQPAHAAEATVLYGITNGEQFPHLFALRRELASWRLLQLDPALLRRRSDASVSDELEPDGSNLAAVLTAIKSETADERSPYGVLGDIGRRLGTLVSGVEGVDAEFDQGRREYVATLEMRDGMRFASSVVSDGTLRILALLAVLHDPRRRGVVLFEEPENGIHPARVRKLVEMLSAMVTKLEASDAGKADGRSESPTEAAPSEPLGQIILASHSPIVLDALIDRAEGRPVARHAEILFADVVGISDPERRVLRRRTRIRSVRHAHQVDAFPDPSFPSPHVSDHEVLEVLNTVGMEG